MSARDRAATIAGGLDLLTDGGGGATRRLLLIGQPQVLCLVCADRRCRKGSACSDRPQHSGLADDNTQQINPRPRWYKSFQTPTLKTLALKSSHQLAEATIGSSIPSTLCSASCVLNSTATRSCSFASSRCSSSVSATCSSTTRCDAATQRRVAACSVRQARGSS